VSPVFRHALFRINQPGIIEREPLDASFRFFSERIAVMCARDVLGPDLFWIILRTIALPFSHGVQANTNLSLWIVMRMPHCIVETVRRGLIRRDMDEQALTAPLGLDAVCQHLRIEIAHIFAPLGRVFPFPQIRATRSNVSQSSPSSQSFKTNFVHSSRMFCQKFVIVHFIRRDGRCSCWRRFFILLNIATNPTGALASITSHTLTKFESGQALPTGSELKSLCLVYGKNVGELFQVFDEDSVEFIGVNYSTQAPTAVLHQTLAHVSRYETLLRAVNEKRLAFDPSALGLDLKDPRACAAGLRRELSLGDLPFKEVASTFEYLGVAVPNLQISDTHLRPGLLSFGNDVHALTVPLSVPSADRRWLLAQTFGLLLCKASVATVQMGDWSRKFADSLLLPSRNLQFDNRRWFEVVEPVIAVKAAFGLPLRRITQVALDAGMITRAAMYKLNVHFTNEGWNSDEPAPWPTEETTFMRQRVVDAVRSQRIPLALGAEILGVASRAIRDSLAMDSRHPSLKRRS
jgi:hypothetical protein